MNEHEDKVFRELGKLEGETWDERDALLRIAKAAKASFDILTNIPCPPWDDNEEIDRRIQEAHDFLDDADIKEMEHLL
ncbi:hypothetical protein KA005_13530 [bacterium]|nr:hypothetical protein [bacterium]